MKTPYINSMFFSNYDVIKNYVIPMLINRRKP